MPRLTILPLFLASLTLLHKTTATYIDDYSHPSIPTVSPIYLTPTLTSTTQSAFYLYPTSSAQNCSCHHHTQPGQHEHPEPYQPSTYISVVHGTASQGHASGYPLASGSGYPLASGSGNATYHPPALSTGYSISTTAISRTSLAPSEGPTSNVETSISSSASGTTLDVTTTSQSPSPTQSEPAEPLFTGGALRLPELQVWKWNIIVSVGLGLMVMWI